MRLMGLTIWIGRSPFKFLWMPGLAVAISAGCGPKQSQPPAVGMPEDSYQRSAYLSNGMIGFRFDEFGTGRFLDSTLGKKQSMFRADIYEEKSKEEKIRPYPNPMTPELRSKDGSCFDRATNLRQELDMKGGFLKTSWNWGTTSIETKTLVHPEKAACYQVWIVSFGAGGEFEAGFRGSGRGRRIQIYDGHSTLVDHDSITFQAKAGQKIEITFWIGERTDLDTDLAKHKEFWKNFWTTRIEIDGPAEDQRAIDSFLFYLRTSTAKNGSYPIGPYGLSSQTYNGHTFWDADVWLFPALALLDPDRARSVPNYRIRTAMFAALNFKKRLSWVRNSPAETDVLPIPALQYPWESGVTGLEVSPTETKQQHHITGSVVWGLKMASDLGLVDSKRVQEIGRQAANFYLSRSVLRTGSELPDAIEGDSTLTYRTILDVVSPDEHHFGDHDLYTNAIAEWVIRTFSKNDGLQPFFLPRDSESYLNYSGDRLRGYKQTSGLLAVFPLQNKKVERDAQVMLSRFADKVSKNGPAMSDSIHATIWARLGMTENAYAAWRAGWKDFVKGPFMLFSEKRARSSTYFTTGAAGALNTVLYGFVGLRLDDEVPASAKFAIPLKNSRWLSVSPNLPKEWRSVKIHGLQVLGKRYTVTVTKDAVTVSP